MENEKTEIFKLLEQKKDNQLIYDGKIYDLGKIISVKDIIEVRQGVEIISKQGIKKLRDYFGLVVKFWNIDHFDFPFSYLHADGIYNDVLYCVVEVSGQGRAPAIEIGEIAPKNMTSVSEKFPMSILYKRAYGRAILDFLYLYHYYAEGEIEQEKQVKQQNYQRKEMVYKCMSCGKEITKNQYSLTLKKYGKPRCNKCIMEMTQKGDKK